MIRQIADSNPEFEGLVEEIVVGDAGRPQTAKELVKQKLANRLCLVHYCKDEPEIRGLCRQHYGYIAKLIREGSSPGWEELEREGKVGPAKKRGGNRKRLRRWLAKGGEVVK